MGNRRKRKGLSSTNNSASFLTVWTQPIQRPAPICLASSVGNSTAPVSQRSRVWIPYKAEFFSGFFFATSKVASITVMTYSHNYNSSRHSSHIWFSYYHSFNSVLFSIWRYVMYYSCRWELLQRANTISIVKFKRISARLCLPFCYYTIKNTIWMFSYHVFVLNERY